MKENMNKLKTKFKNLENNRINNSLLSDHLEKITLNIGIFLEKLFQQLENFFQNSFEFNYILIQLFIQLCCFPFYQLPIFLLFHKKSLFAIIQKVYKKLELKKENNYFKRLVKK